MKVQKYASLFSKKISVLKVTTDTVDTTSTKTATFTAFAFLMPYHFSLI